MLFRSNLRLQGLRCCCNKADFVRIKRRRLKSAAHTNRTSTTDTKPNLCSSWGISAPISSGYWLCAVCCLCCFLKYEGESQLPANSVGLSSHGSIASIRARHTTLCPTIYVTVHFYSCFFVLPTEYKHEMLCHETSADCLDASRRLMCNHLQAPELGCSEPQTFY